MRIKVQAMLGVLLAATFTLLAWTLTVTEKSLAGVGIAGILLGVFAIGLCCVFGFRGHRLVARLTEGSVVIGGYWSDKTIPLESIFSAEKCSESVALQVHDRRAYIDFVYFKDESDIENFVAEVNQRCGPPRARENAIGSALRVCSRSNGRTGQWKAAGCKLLR